VRYTRILTIASTLLLAAGVVLAGEPAPVFGPQTFERTSGETDVYTESFDSPQAGPFVLYLRNGDDECSRVASATVEVNGTLVVNPSDLNEEVAGLQRPVELQAGQNELVVRLNGAPGSFVALAIASPGPPPRFVHGRLLLPWGRNDTERGLALALKNGSPHGPRAIRVVFFNPAGEFVAAAERFVLPPRASMAATVEDLIAAGDWRVGSVEIYYAGPRAGRLCGTARHFFNDPATTEIQTLINAGYQQFRSRPDHPHRALRN
jgi:hypothetical protein